MKDENVAPLTIVHGGTPTLPELDREAVLDTIEYVNGTGMFDPSELVEDGLPAAFVESLTRYMQRRGGKIDPKRPGVWGIDLLRALAVATGADTSLASKLMGRDAEGDELIAEIRIAVHAASEKK